MSSKNDMTTINGLFQEHYSFVVSVARWHAPSQELADGIVQQVYIEFAQCGTEGKLDLNQSIRSFLYHLTKRQAALAWRKRSTEQKRYRPIEELSEFLADSAGAGPEDDQYEQLENEVTLLNDCLEALSDKSRDIITRHYFNKISIKQIAEDENQTASAMRHFFCRVRMKLKQCIEKKQK